ncbi:discoidin domain-containing protein [Phytoactinopolyspora endophytica]|uniref:discoidin domain-containing protein n=1 Tax=Phytoactinopolyspora endophytica TaxID=1642495 RepID=UPI0013EB8AC8|nr:discoidin domain-containing protein [Phytoactinopolyspora endophytica]
MAHGTVLDVMVFNIWHGGNLDKFWDGAAFNVVHRHGFEEQNKAELLEFLAHERPDLILMVETYGLGERIEAALNRRREDGRVFRGVPITREQGQLPGRDNLWLFTWLPVEEVYPVVSEPPVTSFHFGGARLGLPGGGHVHAFTAWISHIANAWGPVNQAAMESALGLERSHWDEELVASDDPRRREMARTILTERVAAFADDDAPVLLGGDLNTQTHLDWSPEFADAPRHEGLVLHWPVMRMFADAGFADVFRTAHPDAARYPGRTWTAGHSFMYAPMRLDYLLARGDVEVLASSTRTRRLPEHRGGALDELYPFYSDHGAVVSRLRFGGDREGYRPERPLVEEPEIVEWPEIPKEPAGRRVPRGEMSVQASSAASDHGASLAVDGDPRTSWHSRAQPSPPDPHPHELTVDLGNERTLAAVRYQPPIDGYQGIVTRYTYSVSDDGQTFEPVSSGTWARDSLPKDVLLPGVRARYLRLTAHAGVAGYSAAAELIPYVRD